MPTALLFSNIIEVHLCAPYSLGKSYFSVPSNNTGLYTKYLIKIHDITESKLQLKVVEYKGLEIFYFLLIPEKCMGKGSKLN